MSGQQTFSSLQKKQLRQAKAADPTMTYNQLIKMADDKFHCSPSDSQISRMLGKRATYPNMKDEDRYKARKQIRLAKWPANDHTLNPKPLILEASQSEQALRGKPGILPSIKNRPTLHEGPKRKQGMRRSQLGQLIWRTRFRSLKGQTRLSAGYSDVALP